MSWRKVLFALLLASFVGGGYFLYNDYQFRKMHGLVVDVSLANWDKEVEQVKDKKPVLIYFWRSGVHPDQDKAVSDIAWWWAGKARVVKFDCDKPENRFLALTFLVGRYPAFVVLYHQLYERSAPGSHLDYQQLERLLKIVQQSSATP